MKKVYVLVAVSLAAFGAASAGSMSFASGECQQSYGCSNPDDSVPSTDDSVPSTEPTTTEVQDTTTTVDDTSTSAAATTSIATTTSVAGLVPTTAVEASSTSASETSVDQLLPTSVTPTSVGSDGLLPNTGGGDIAIPLILAGLAAGTGAATLLVRRRSNVS